MLAKEYRRISSRTLLIKLIAGVTIMAMATLKGRSNTAGSPYARSRDNHPAVSWGPSMYPEAVGTGARWRPCLYKHCDRVLARHLAPSVSPRTSSLR
jgi:hypothetical protein